MYKIHKYPLKTTGDMLTQISVPGDFQHVVKFGEDPAGIVCVWILFQSITESFKRDEFEEVEPHHPITFMLVPTGGEVSDDFAHDMSAQIGIEVWHLFSTGFDVPVTTP